MATQGTYITVAEAAERLGVAKMTAYRLIAAGEMPAVRVGNQYRVDPEELRAWLEASRTRKAES